MRKILFGIVSVSMLCDVCGMQEVLVRSNTFATNANLFYDEAKRNSKFEDENSQRKMLQNYIMAAKLGHVDAVTELIKLGRVDAVVQCVQLGYVNVVVELGKYYLNSDKNFAFYLFRIGAEVYGDAEAMFYLGGCYRNGYGVPKDYNKAVEILIDSGNLGNDNARRALSEDDELKKIFGPIKESNKENFCW